MEKQLELKTGEEESEVPEAPILIGGIAQPAPRRKRGRPLGSKNSPRASTSGSSARSADQDNEASTSSPKKKKAKLTLNLADTFGPELVSQAARAPIFMGDMAVSVASKGKLAPINYIPQGPMLAVDEFFKENILKGGIEFEVNPLQGWLALCGLALLSGIVGQTAEYAFKLKAEAGTLPNVGHGSRPGEDSPNGSVGPEVPSPGMEEVPGQPRSSPANPS